MMLLVKRPKKFTVGSDPKTAYTFHFVFYPVTRLYNATPCNNCISFMLSCSSRVCVIPQHQTQQNEQGKFLESETFRLFKYKEEAMIIPFINILTDIFYFIN